MSWAAGLGVGGEDVRESVLWTGSRGPWEGAGQGAGRISCEPRGRGGLSGTLSYYK